MAAINPAWSSRPNLAKQGIALARESGHILCGSGNGLTLLDALGKVQATRPAPKLVRVAASDDGFLFAAVDRGGAVTTYYRDLSPRWTHELNEKVCGLAVGCLGQCVAAGDHKGTLHVIGKLGSLAFAKESPKAIYHLAFVPQTPVLITAADLGRVAGFAFSNREFTWQDRPVTHIGGLAVNGDGHRIILGCFSEGIRRYGPDGKALGPITLPEPCRLAAITYDGRFVLAAGLGEKLYALTWEGEVLCQYACEKPITGLALRPRGDFAAVSLNDGRVVGLDSSAAFG